MVDITMCCNSDCPLRGKCYRYLAKPDPYWQSFALFTPEDKPFGGYGDKVLECDHYWELDPRRDDWIPQKTVDNRYERDEKWKGIK